MTERSPDVGCTARTREAVDCLSWRNSVSFCPIATDTGTTIANRAIPQAEIRRFVCRLDTRAPEGRFEASKLKYGAKL